MKNTFIDQIIQANKDNKLIKNYKRNEIIFFEEQGCEFVSIILKGSIYMTSLFNDTEIKFNYMKKGQMFGHNLIFSKNNKYKAHIVAIGNTQILHLTKDEFVKSLQNLNILEEYLAFMAQFTLDDKEMIKILQIQKLRDRILYILNTNKGVYRFKNIATLAIKLGVSRETLSRELIKMEEEFILTKTNNVIRLN